MQHTEKDTSHEGFPARNASPESNHEETIKLKLRDILQNNCFFKRLIS